MEIRVWESRMRYLLLDYDDRRDSARTDDVAFRQGGETNLTFTRMSSKYR